MVVAVEVEAKKVMVAAAVEVEAKNFVLNIGHQGWREPVVQPTTPKKEGGSF